MDNIKNVILEAAKEEIGEQRKERNQDWCDDECQIAMKEKMMLEKMSEQGDKEK